eukprot:TRINITY_DN910_c0_g1_i1.p1 TRINITY_DN910_c0_g1~~TRINITY_DN910_c0_g1_i1.p1  ORF type:complete len:276 (-),score=56.10 TRINITY_DN910_c0_g1_i1:170-997(-)
MKTNPHESTDAPRELSHRKSWTAEQILRAVASLLYVVPSLLGLLAATPVCLSLQPILKYLGVHRNYLPVDVLQSEWSAILLRIMGVEIEIEGADNVKLDQPCLLMFKHVSQLDPLILIASSPLTARFIGKKSVFKVPVFGWVVGAFGHIPIERENLESAVESIKAAGKLVSQSGSAVAVSPEGTRSLDDSLLPFKKGPFYLAHESHVDIVPCILVGAFDRWRPRTVFPKPGKVKMVFLPAIKNDGSKSRDELSMLVRRSMEDYLAKMPAIPKSKL